MPLKWDAAYIDSPLAPEGIIQAQAAKLAIQQLPISKILVSPFRRTLQTCELLFGDMPNRPPVKVCPLIAEKCGNAPDLSNFFGVPFEDFAHYDWSELTFQSQYWLLDNVQNAHTADIAARASSPQQTQELMLAAMKTLSPEKLEAKEDLFRRAERVREYLKPELRQGNVAIVTHLNFTKDFTVRLLGEKKVVANCGVLRLSLP
jgi:broad specificity phosphatase PhoE